MQTSWIKVKKFQLCCTNFSVLTFPPPHPTPASPSPCMLHVCFSEKCYETTHLHYYEAGESWGRIHLRNVEQCTCAAGEIKCERVHYTSKSQCFINLNELENKAACSFWFRITSDSYQAQRKGITSPPWSCFFDQGSMVTTSRWMKRQII